MTKRIYRMIIGIILSGSLLFFLYSENSHDQSRSHTNMLQSSDKTHTRVEFKEKDKIPEKIRYDTFVFVWETIRDKYFDPTFGGVNWNEIREFYYPLVKRLKTSESFHSLLNKMLNELSTSHLIILAPRQLNIKKKKSTKSKFTLEGIELRISDGHVVIYTVEPNSPAWNTGLRPGNVLIKASDLLFTNPEKVNKSQFRLLKEARKALVGKKSSIATFIILDKNNRKRTLFCPRTAPYLESIRLGRAILEFRKVHPRVGYIWFDKWSFDLKSKLEPAFKELWNTDGLILDFRQNPGGVNPGADYLASILNAEDGLLAIETRRNGERSEWEYSGSGKKSYQGLVVILIDEASGSTSEIFAGAMQESGRAVVLGYTSYGGVLNSTQEILPTGGILQYPHSDMRTPKGRRIEGLGVIPDISVELKREDLLEEKDTVIEMAVKVILKKVSDPKKEAPDFGGLNEKNFICTFINFILFCFG